MTEPSRPSFVAEDTYRRRRVRDAARLLPLLGLFLFMLPLFWIGAGRGTATGGAGIYLFAAWLLLIVLAAWIARRIGTDASAPGGSEGEAGGGDGPL